MANDAAPMRRGHAGFALHLLHQGLRHETGGAQLAAVGDAIDGKLSLARLTLVRVENPSSA
jgi:hypothetical protein